VLGHEIGVLAQPITRSFGLDDERVIAKANSQVRRRHVRVVEKIMTLRGRIYRSLCVAGRARSVAVFSGVPYTIVG
jgi:hypothetical protein